MQYYHQIIEKDVDEILKKVDFNNLIEKKILITGATGLVGIYMLSCLKNIARDYKIEIHICTNSTIDENNYFKYFLNDIHIHNFDLTKKIPLREKFDIIIHSAGYGQPSKFLSDKIKTIQINTTTTITLLNLLKKDGRFLFISTSELYSGLDSEQISEKQIGTTTTKHQRSCYIESKRCGETICFSYDNPNIKVARLSLAYGPGTKPNDSRVLNQLIQKGLLENEIRLLDDGSALRTYCYISDAVQMFWNILLNSQSNLYNVGGISKISILELATTIGNKLGVPVIVNHKNIGTELNGSPKIVNISVEKYLDEFGNVVFTELDSGLDRTIQWQKQFYK